MLADIEPWQFQELRAAYRIDPWGDDWPQAARIEAAIRNTMGGESIHASEIIANEVVPQPEEDVDPSQLNAAMRARAGF